MLPNLLPNVKVIYSANVDGEMEPCGCRSNPTGGINRRWRFLKQFGLGTSLSIDSGDLFYQSVPAPPFLSKQWNYQARVLLRAYNSFGVEVMTPGELDFANGLDQLESLMLDAKFKMISANLYRKSTGKLLFSPSVVLNKGGKRVALFGIIDETLQLPPEVEARDHLAAAQKMVSELRTKADVVVALTHQGLEKDIELAKAVPGIDAIFGAHTQSFLIEPTRVGDTLIFQPSFRGQHIGLYADGENKMYQIDDRFDTKSGETPNPLDKVLSDSKTDIARINKEAESELMGSNPFGEPTKKLVAHFQTFTQCAQCHTAQYDFHKNTPHMKAYATLVKAKQSANLDCLKCHTVGMQSPGGWTAMSKLVLSKTNKPIDAKNFATSLPNMDEKALSKVSKAFINVQCENCHGAAGGHPTEGVTALSKDVSTTTCLQCHTADRAPQWYKNGKPDLEVIQAKFKSMTCPATKH